MGNLIIKPNTGGDLKLQDEGGTDAIAINTSGGVSGTAVKDEDNMAANSATHLATQQSIKAYVDTAATQATTAAQGVGTGDSPTFAGFGGNAGQATAKAWVNFNGTGTVAIRDSFNVSSITDSDVGTYIVNFDTSLANANYSCITSVQEDITLNNWGYIVNFYTYYTTSQLGLRTCNNSATVLDTAWISATVFGD
jgi:hypothetical protein